MPVIQNLANVISIGLALLAILNVRDVAPAEAPLLGARVFGQAFIIIVVTLSVAAVFCTIMFGRQAIEARYPWARYYFVEHSLKMHRIEVNTKL